MSAAIRLPLARLVTVPRGVISTFSTSSPKRKVTAWSRRWNLSDSTTSGSQNSSICGRFSTTVTRVPSAANIEAYSIPITPAPTTTSDPGTRCSFSTASESITWSSSNSTSGGRAGRVPVAITMFAAVTVSLSPRASPRDDDGVLVLEAGGAAEDVDVVAQQLVADHLDLPADHVRGAGQQVGDGDLGLDPVAGAVHVALGEPGQVEHGLAQRLGRDGAGVDADPAHHVAPLGHAHPLAQLGRGDGGLLPARAGADHQQVVVVHRRSSHYPVVATVGRRCRRPASPAGRRPGKRARLTVVDDIPRARDAAVHSPAATGRAGPVATVGPQPNGATRRAPARVGRRRWHASSDEHAASPARSRPRPRPLALRPQPRDAAPPARPGRPIRAARAQPVRARRRTGRRRAAGPGPGHRRADRRGARAASGSTRASRWC